LAGAVGHLNIQDTLKSQPLKTLFLINIIS
jgi:hypothetical protein